jgi:putative glutamine amidotransferase
MLVRVLSRSRLRVVLLAFLCWAGLAGLAAAEPQAFVVDVPNLGPMVMMGEDASSAVRTYVEGVIRRGAFSRGRGELRKWSREMHERAKEARPLDQVRDQRPLIGIQISEEQDLLGAAKDPKERVAYANAKAIRRAGGMPVFLPPAASMRQIRPTLHLLDHLFLSGGPDIHPSLYGQPITHAHANEIDLVRDRYEMRLTQTAFKLGLGVEGVCRGCQMMNVAAGGTLTQDLKLDGVTEDQHGGGLDQPVQHPIKLEPDSATAAVIGKVRLRTVQSWHHQAVKDVAPGFRIVAKHGPVPEALESKSGRARCYQFHPERSPRAGYSKAIFKDMVGRAAAYRASK